MREASSRAAISTIEREVLELSLDRRTNEPLGVSAIDTRFLPLLDI